MEVEIIDSARRGRRRRRRGFDSDMHAQHGSGDEYRVAVDVQCDSTASGISRIPSLSALKWS
jgi:hypothetical protein